MPHLLDGGLAEAGGAVGVVRRQPDAAAVVLRQPRLEQPHGRRRVAAAVADQRRVQHAQLGLALVARNAERRAGGLEAVSTIRTSM
jgi:hypothetical protein